MILQISLTAFYALSGPVAILGSIFKPAAETKTAVPWWLWVILIIIVLILVWFLISLLTKKETPPPAKIDKIAQAPQVPEPPKVSAPAVITEKTAETPMMPTAPMVSPTAMDDLKIIEGIGPKIASLLQETGIHTFEQLSKTPVSRLQDILQTANLRLADPGTWPQQASLAAIGKWDELKALQDSLKGGKQVV
jgi:predicted flap endonuclease-1-like 5' DNA nuclease